MSVVADSNAAVNDLADRFWDGVLERDPLWATVLGDERFNDRWPDLGEDGRAADEAAFRSVLAEATDIPADGLDPEQVITRDLLILVAENHLEALAQKQYQLAVDHMSGPQIWPVQVAQYQPADTPEKLELLLTRYRAFPAMIKAGPDMPGAAAGQRTLDALKDDSRPLLMLWGAEDAALPPAVGEAFASALGRPAPHVLDGAGHFLQEDRGEEVGALIADWLDSA